MEREIFKDNNKILSVSITASDVDSLKVSDITKTGMRVYDKGLIGVSGTTGEADENRLYEKAKKDLENKIPYPFEIASDLKREVNIKKDIINEKDFVKECETILEILKKRYSNFSYSNKIQLIERNTELSNTKGLSLKHSENIINFSLAFKEKSSLNIMDGDIGYAGRSYDRNDVIDYFGQALEAYNNEVDLPRDGTYPVAFFIQDTDTPILNKFSADMDGRAFGSGTSLFSGKIGKKLFSDDLTLYQTHHPSDTILTPFFDMEGTINNDLKYTLIEDGVIKTPYTDKKTANMYGFKNTGNARGSYDDVPSLKKSFLEGTNLAIKPGRKTIKELFGGKKGILSIVASGGDFNSSGDFGTPIQLAFLFDGNKIIGRLPQISVSSNVYKMFGNNFRGVSSDTVFKHSNDRLFVADMDVSRI